MDLDADTAYAYIGEAAAQMVGVARRLGDERVNERPHGPATNTVAALITHCCGVAGWWLGHVALGHPSDRDRAAEFTAVATVADLEALVAAMLARARADLDALAAGAGRPHALRAELPGRGDDASVVLHVIEELYQHLGHMELTADALAT